MRYPEIHRKKRIVGKRFLISKMKYFKHAKALVHSGAQIGEGTRVWAFTNIQPGAVIGKECNICDGCFIENGVLIGDYVTIKNHVSVFSGVHIEDNVFVGANVAFINDRYPRSHRENEWVLEKTIIKKGATLGSNSTILCGISIGEYAVIGAGSVITKSVPAHIIMHGNPAKENGYACYCGRRLNEDLKCACGKKYISNDQGLEIDE